MDEEQAELEQRLQEARRIEEELRKEKAKVSSNGRTSSIPVDAKPLT